MEHYRILILLRREKLSIQHRKYLLLFSNVYSSIYLMFLISDMDTLTHLLKASLGTGILVIKLAQLNEKWKNIG